MKNGRRPVSFGASAVFRVKNRYDGITREMRSTQRARISDRSPVSLYKYPGHRLRSPFEWLRADCMLPEPANVLRAFAGSFVLPGDAPSSACLHSAGRCPRPLRPKPCPKPFETAVKSFFFVYRFDLFSVCFRIFVQVCPVILSQIFGLFCARSTKLPTPPKIQHFALTFSTAQHYTCAAKRRRA